MNDGETNIGGRIWPTLTAEEMRLGARRSDAPYAWPDALLSPPGGRPLIYLDLNHWIGLAKAATGHRDGDRHRDALAVLRSSDVTFPLSAAHYMEMAGIASPRQRYDVASVMEELSGFDCLMPNHVLMRVEVDVALRRIVPGLRRLHEPVPLLGRGVLQAFGLKGGLAIKTTAGDVTHETRAAWRGGPDAFDVWRGNAERLLDRSVLRGPSDEEAPSLRQLGWDPTVARQGAELRAQQERNQAKRFAAYPRVRRERLRDAIAGRYLISDAADALAEVTAAHGLRLSEALPKLKTARTFTDSMPAGDVWISLVSAAHRNPQTRWSSNDIFDIDALCIAVPYCDIVVTERHAHHVLHSAGLPERLDTQVLTTLEELVSQLSSPAC